VQLRQGNVAQTENLLADMRRGGVAFNDVTHYLVMRIALINSACLAWPGVRCGAERALRTENVEGFSEALKAALAAGVYISSNALHSFVIRVRSPLRRPRVCAVH
jgi:hypothetical protein